MFANASQQCCRSSFPIDAAHERVAQSTLSMAASNLINMVAITAVSGAVLLALLAAKRF